MATTNLISTIMANADANAELIFEKTSAEEREIIQKRVAEANHQREIIFKKAQSEAINKAARIISRAELSVRNNKLEAKQQMIQKVFELVLQRLRNLSSEELCGLIKGSILAASFEGEAELILSKLEKEKVKESFQDEINSALRQQGRNAHVTINTRDVSIDSGFILSQEGIEINGGFDALVASLKEEMEYEVISILFGQ